MPIPAGPVETSIEFGPQGAKIEGEKLVWTPTYQDTGPGVLRLRFKRDEQTQVRDYQYFVSNTPIPLPFYAIEVALSSDGQIAAVWGQETGHRSNIHTRMAVVDSQKVMAEGHCNVLAVTGSRTAIPSDGVRQSSAFPDGPDDTILFVEVAPEASVVWTKPDDLELGENGAGLEKLAWRSIPDSEKKWLYVQFARSRGGLIESETSRDQILRAVQIDDGEASGLFNEDQ